jgi:hypothetical protein
LIEVLFMGENMSWGSAPESTRVVAIAACSTALPDHTEEMFVLLPDRGPRCL